jgi:beta-lactamase class A
LKSRKEIPTVRVGKKFLFGEWIFSGIVCAGLICNCLAQENQGPALLKAKLEEDLQALAGRLNGVFGYAIKDLTNGESILRFENEVFPTASTIKIAVLLEMFKQAEAGTLKLDERWRIDPAQRVAGSGVLFELSDPQLMMTATDVATLMIVLSDNFATNLCIQHAGQAAINAGLEKMGLRATRLRRIMMDLPAAKRGDENTSSPAELLQILEGLHSGKLLSKPYTDRLLTILKKDKQSSMRKAIPLDIAVANKPGDIDGVRCDAGIVYLPGRPYIFVGMTKYLESGEKGEETLFQATKAVHSCFERLVNSNVYGRAVAR